MSDTALPVVNFNDPTCVVCNNIAMVADGVGYRHVFWCNTCGARLAVDLDETGRLVRTEWSYPTNAAYVPPKSEPELPRRKPFNPSPDFLLWMAQHRAGAAAAIRDRSTQTFGNCFIEPDQDGGWVLHFTTIDFTTLHPQAQKDFWHKTTDPDGTYMYLRSHPDLLKPSR